MKGGLALTAIGVIALIVLSAGVIAFIIDPAGMLALGNQVSQGAYKATGGYIGQPPPPPPPVKFNVGEVIRELNGSLAIDWAPQQTIKGSVFMYFGSCKYPAELYGLNITNEANLPIVKIVINNTGTQGTPYPLPKPWTTNSSFYAQAWEGNATNWQFINVNIPPHTTVIVWNASSLTTYVPIYFYFANGSYYKAYPSFIPNYPV